MGTKRTAESLLRAHINSRIVIPAKAGTQLYARAGLGPGFRRDDGMKKYHSVAIPLASRSNRFQNALANRGGLGFDSVLPNFGQIGLRHQ